MDREEAIELLEDVIGFIEDNQGRDYDTAFRMAIEALSADAVQGVGRYENAVQKLRDMPRYLNGVKEKQITKVSANYTTEKPNDAVEQKNDVVVESTDLISRADALMEARPEYLNPNQEKLASYNQGWNNAIEMYYRQIAELPSANKTELLKDGTLKVKTDNGADVKRVLVWGDDGCGGLYYADDRPSGEWEDKEVFSETNDDHIVDEWQSAKCSVCGKYHTTPYMYYFDSFNYCPNCGAKMGSD